MSENGFLMVRLRERRIGLPIGSVIAVESPGALHPVPASDPACRGVTSKRGRLMPVLSLAALVETVPGDEPTATRLRAITARLGGHATLVRASAEARDALPVFEPEPPTRAGLTRAVKAAFDPHRLFNPGRMFEDC